MTKISDKQINCEKVLRSLLQKAVRRGDVDLAEAVFNSLYLNGSKVWLRHRLAVIAVEENWPLCSLLEPAAMGYKQLAKILLVITSSCKDKSAAGLGSLGYEYSNGDKSVLTGSSDDVHVRIVAAGIKRPADYWGWIRSQCVTSDQVAIINNANYYFQKGGLPWDKAFFIAAAYLITQINLGSIVRPEKITTNTPLWIAFDKHTKEGRRILNKVSKATNTGLNMLQIINFYFESCKTNASNESYWWNREMHWRLSRENISVNSASALWDRIVPIYSNEAFSYAESLGAYLKASINEHPTLRINNSEVANDSFS